MAIEETLRANFAYTLKSLLCLPDVSHGNGKKGFGENALNVRGKIFAMLTPTQGFVVKLHKDRAQEMFESGLGAPFQMAGRQMKEWVVGSTPISRTLQLSPIMGQEECHATAKEVQRRVQA